MLSKLVGNFASSVHGAVRESVALPSYHASRVLVQSRNAATEQHDPYPVDKNDPEDRVTLYFD